MLLSNKNIVQAPEAKSKYKETSEMGEILYYQVEHWSVHGWAETYWGLGLLLRCRHVGMEQERETIKAFNDFFWVT